MDEISYEHRTAHSESSHQHLYLSVSRFLAKVSEGASVMDVGCGNGSFLSLFRNRNWRLYGSDLSSTGIEVARKTFPNIKFLLIEGQVFYSSFLATVGQMDVVISTEVIEHVYDPRGFLRNCYSLLKPGGTLVISTPYHGYLKNLLLSITGKMDRHFTALWDHGHIKFWSKGTITQALQETGFINVQFAGSGRIPFVWMSMVLRATKPISAQSQLRSPGESMEPIVESAGSLV